MSQRLARILSHLRDSGKYVRVPGVNIFDEHEEVYYVDSDKRPCRQDAPNAKRMVRTFDKKALASIAQACNKRDLTGSLAPITYGHTISPGEDSDGNAIPIPESNQPPPRGYAATYGVGYDPDLKKHYLRTDFYIRKQDYDEAETYPRVSVELWPKHGIIDPIALLRRTPQQDVGQWTYGKGGDRVLRYSKEFQMADTNAEDLFDKKADDDALPPLPDGPVPDPVKEVNINVEEDPEDTDEMAHHRHMEHCERGPDKERSDRYAKTRYGATEEPADSDSEVAPPVEEAPPGGMLNELPDPTDAPDADEPLQHGANGAFVKPSATNAVLPPAAKKPVKFDKTDASGDRAVQYQRELAAVSAKLARSEAQLIVQAIVHDNYMIDADKEIAVFANLTEPQRHSRDEYIRQHVRRAPVGGRRLPIDTSKAGDNVVINLEEDPESIPAKDRDKVLQYGRDKKLYDLPFHELAAKAMPHKYGRNGSAKKGD